MSTNYDPIEGVSKADQIWSSTTGDSIQVCDHHATSEQVQRVAGPFKVHFFADLVGNNHAHNRNCERCLQIHHGQPGWVRQ